MLPSIKRNNQGSINVILTVGFLNSVGGEQLDAATVELFHRILGFRQPVARVNNRGNPDAGIEQLSGKSQTCLIMADNNCACTRLHSIQVQQSPHSAAKHDAG